MARQFEISTGWPDASLLVGWDPAFGTYYAQIFDGSVGEQEPLLWLTPKAPGIQDVNKFEAYINQNIKGRWPAIRLIKILRINLERDMHAEGGYHNDIPARTNLGVMPPSVSSSGIVFSYREGDSTEDAIEDIKDWFFDNYEDAEISPDTEVDFYQVKDEILKYWLGEYPNAILNAAIKDIEETDTLTWVAASWRFDVLEDA